MWEKKKSIVVGEFFSGPGGMALGAKQACANHNVEFEHAWAIDVDPEACKTYAHNILGEGRTLSPRDVTAAGLIEELWPVDLFLFGFPCNDFSTAGESKGLEGSFGKLYRAGIDYIDAHKPTAFVAENVYGLMQSRNGAESALEKIVAEMRAKNYDVYPHLYKLEQYGIPQARHRILIVGIKNDGKRNPPNFLIPPPHTADPSRYISARAAIDGGVLHDGKPIADDAFNHVPSVQSRTVTERMKYIDAGENIWEAMASGKVPPDLCIKASKTNLSQIYRRLHPDLPAYTITASGGGGTGGYHWSEPRSLTNRERARLQTFPDDYKFFGGVGRVRKQIGMAVPPEAARIVIGAVIGTLRGKRVKGGIEPNLRSHDQVAMAFQEEARHPTKGTRAKAAL